jgi:hypothetical protein
MYLEWFAFKKQIVTSFSNLSKLLSTKLRLSGDSDSAYIVIVCTTEEPHLGLVTSSLGTVFYFALIKYFLWVYLLCKWKKVVSHKLVIYWSTQKNFWLWKIFIKNWGLKIKFSKEMESLPLLYMWLLIHTLWFTEMQMHLLDMMAFSVMEKFLYMVVWTEVCFFLTEVKTQIWLIICLTDSNSWNWPIHQGPWRISFPDFIEIV